jgi:hypothetical protein
VNATDVAWDDRPSPPELACAAQGGCGTVTVTVTLDEDEARPIANDCSCLAADRGRRKIKAALDGPRPGMGSTTCPGGLQDPTGKGCPCDAP